MNARNPRIFLPVAAACVVAVSLATGGLLDGAPGSARAAEPGNALEATPGRRSPGKPRPPVEVSLLPGMELQAGVPAQLALQIRSAEQIEVTDLVVEGDDGLEVVSARREVPGTTGTRYQTGGEAARFEISAVPMSGGTRQLSGLLRFNVNGVSQAVPFRLPIEVGGPVTVPTARAQKPVREPLRDTAGGLIDSIPAETTVR